MPQMCFSYSADAPMSARHRGAAERALRDIGSMPGYPCFGYPGDMPLGTGNRAAAPSAPPGPRLMPLPCFNYPYMCFSYPPDVPPGTRNRNAAQLDRLGLRKMPATHCFRY